MALEERPGGVHVLVTVKSSCYINDLCGKSAHASKVVLLRFFAAIPFGQNRLLFPTKSIIEAILIERCL